MLDLAVKTLPLNCTKLRAQRSLPGHAGPKELQQEFLEGKLGPPDWPHQASWGKPACYTTAKTVGNNFNTNRASQLPTNAEIL